MRDYVEINEIAKSALARANDIEAASVAAVEQLIAQSRERDTAGRPTKASRTAGQALASPALTSTLASVALRRSINPALNTAIDQVARAETEYRIAIAALRALNARKDLYDDARGTPRKRAVVEEEVEPEEWTFIREMRARNVPVSALDQLTEPELDFIAGLFVEKQKDFRHRDRAGAWWTLVRSGLLDVSSQAFNEDERAAILAATDAGAERARQAYEALCDLAGRKLDIPHSFAEFVLAFAEESSTADPIGAFERNVTHIESEQWRADAERLLELLGLPIGELSRAVRLMRSPPLVSFKERQQQAHDAALKREAEYRALVDRYRPAARAALADRHDAERRQERERVGADALGSLDIYAALKLLGADDEELSIQNARVIRQVREGTYFSDREEERRRTIERLAAELAVSPARRKTLAAMGISLPESGEEVSEPAVEPTDTTAISEGGDMLAPDTVRQASLAIRPPSAQDLGLPADVTSEAAVAYYNIARKFSLQGNDWYQATHPWADADPTDQDSVAAMLEKFENAERRASLDEVSRRYLAILREQSIVEANAFLLDREARRVVLHVATSYDFEQLRKDAGFPRLSQRR